MGDAGSTVDAERRSKVACLECGAVTGGRGDVMSGECLVTVKEALTEGHF